jgi:arylsulfatase A-like enzyme
MKINRLQSFCIWLIMFAISMQLKAQENKHPNIILILADDLGYGDLSCLGGKDVLTPNIDLIAKRGIQFTNFYANSTVCSPTRASLLSGKYPDMVGVPGVIRQEKKDSWGKLKEGIELLPAILKKSNYHTALIGKWHLGYQSPDLPNDRGFDQFKGFLGDMMDDYYTHLRGGVNWMRHNKTTINPTGHATDIFTQWTIEYLNERKNQAPPFFLYLSYNAPHFPIQPPAEYLEKVKTRIPGADDKRARNIALVEHMDYAIGQIVKTLKENGQLKNTLIIFSSDNGGSLPHAQSNGELNGGKQNMLEGGIKVPFFMYWENQIKQGSKSDQLSMTMDILPTLADIAGIKTDQQIDGISLMPFMQKETSDVKRTVFWVRREGGAYNGQSYYAARKGNMKILQNQPFEPFVLYDLSKDPFEKNPMDPKDHSEGLLLKKSLMEHIQLSGRVPWQQPN